MQPDIFHKEILSTKTRQLISLSASDDDESQN